MKKFLLSISLAMACALTAYADKASDYKEYATRVRAEVWADSLPQFSAPPQVPDKYKNEYLRRIKTSVQKRKQVLDLTQMPH